MNKIYEVQGVKFGTLKQAVEHGKKFQFSCIYSNGDLVALVVKLLHGFNVSVLPKS